jgi:hypothetical protein
VGFAEGWMLTAISPGENLPLLVCKVRTNVLPPPTPHYNDSVFVAQCVGCGRQIDSYPIFCDHFRLADLPKEQVLKFYCMYDADSKRIKIQPEGRLPIPWPREPVSVFNTR